MRDPTQGEIQINGVSSTATGLRKREGSETVALISSTAAPFESVAFHHIRRDEVNQYLAVLSRTQVRVFRLDGTVVPVTMAQGAAAYLSQAVDASADLRGITVGDFTFVTNLRVKAAMDPTVTPVTPRPAPHEALVWVKAANYGQVYNLQVNGLGVKVETAVTPTSVVDDVVVPNRISVDEIAARLRAGLLGGSADTVVVSGGPVQQLGIVSPLPTTTFNGTRNSVDTESDGDGTGLRINVVCNGATVTSVSLGSSAGVGYVAGDKVFVRRGKIDGTSSTTLVWVATVTTTLGPALAFSGTRTSLPTTTNRGGTGLRLNVTGDGTSVTSVTIADPGAGGYAQRDKLFVARNLLLGGADISPILVGSVTGVSPGPLTGVTIEQAGSVLHLQSQSPITLAAFDGNGNSDITVITDKVQAFTDLPATAPVGYVVEITGDQTNRFDSYYLSFSPRSGTFGEGAWEECPASGVEYRLNPATMPHLLVRDSAGATFWFGPALAPGAAQPLPGVTLPSWGQRTAGDYESNPDPSFIGNSINDIFFYRNRQCFLSGEGVICSRAGKPFDFFRETVVTVVDSDPVDVQASQDRISIFSYAAPFQDEVVFFSKELQMRLTSDDASLSAASARVAVLTSYECDLGCRPIQMAGSLVFAQRNGDWSQVREFRTYGSGFSLNADAVEITDHVRNYIPAKIRQMVCNEAGNILIALSGKNCFSNRLYIYKFYNQASGGQMSRVQSSWSHWEFKTSDEIKAILCVDQTLFMVVRYGEQVWLEKISVADRPQRRYAGDDEDGDTLVVPHEVYLDRRVSNTLNTPLVSRVPAGTYDPVSDTTCWTLPFVIKGRVQAWAAFADTSRCNAPPPLPPSLPVVNLVARSPVLASGCGSFPETTNFGTLQVQCGDLFYNNFTDIDFENPYTFSFDRSKLLISFGPGGLPLGIYIPKYKLDLPVGEGILLAKAKFDYSFTGSPANPGEIQYYLGFDNGRPPVKSLPLDPNAESFVPYADLINVLPTMEMMAPDTVVTGWTNTFILTSSFTLTRSGSTLAPLAVQVAYSGTAISGSDYKPYLYVQNDNDPPVATTTLTFAIGQNTLQVIVVPELYSLIAGGKTVVMTILPSPDYSVGSGSPGTATILQA